MELNHFEKKRFDRLAALRAMILPLTLIFAILLWGLVVRLGDIQPFLRPPGMVWARLLQILADGSLLRHTLVTLKEVLAGLGLGVIAATALGYLLAKSQVVERLLSRSSSPANRCPWSPSPFTDHLVRPGVVFQGTDLCLDCLLSGAGEHGRRPALGTGRAA
jgi:hypothetical protein